MLPLVLLVVLLPAFSAEPPRFTDPQRVSKLKAAFPEVEKVFERFHSSRGLPGSVWGIVIDGELAYVKSFGVRDRAAHDAVTAKTAFRIASMTKSFTAAALLKLRDEGKLSLEDPVEKWIPEFKNYRYPTTDSVPLRLRQLVSHGAGFPEDNPWGDRQLAESDAVLGQWVKAGIPFSTTPDTAYEYSNYGFALAGRVIQKASGMSYRDYVEKRILLPLGMRASTMEPSAVDAKVRATGYGRRGTDEYFVIPSLAHGSFGAMGGMVTTAEDLSKWVAYLLSAFPPRDGAEAGPVRRASLREMQRVQRTSDLLVERERPGLRANSGGYGFGLRISQDCKFEHIVGHGGGLPGFGSYMLWLPEHGVGMFAMTNLTYQGPSQALSDAFDVLRGTGGLRARVLPPAPVLTRMRDAVLASVWNRWDEKAVAAMAANNLFPDQPAEDRKREIEQVRRASGRCEAPGAVEAENWLRGRFRMRCERGEVDVAFTLAPTNPPRVQYLSFRHIGAIGATLRSGAEAWLATPAATQRLRSAGCRLGRIVAGDGTTSARVVVECPQGPAAMVAFRLNTDGKVELVGDPQRAPGARCAP